MIREGIAALAAAALLAGCTSSGTPTAAHTVTVLSTPSAAAASRHPQRTPAPTKTGPPTSGPAADYRFLSMVGKIHDLHLELQTHKHLIHFAHQACDALSEHLESANGLVRDITRAYVSRDAAERYLNDVVLTYCPSNKSSIGQ